MAAPLLKLWLQLLGYGISCCTIHTRYDVLTGSFCVRPTVEPGVISACTPFCAILH